MLAWCLQDIQLPPGPGVDWDELTIINLLQGDLCIMREGLLGLGREHEGLGLLRRSHAGCLLRIHGDSHWSC